MAAHARLKNEFTEDEKCHNLMSWFKCLSSLLVMLCHMTLFAIKQLVVYSECNITVGENDRPSVCF